MRGRGIFRAAPVCAGVLVVAGLALFHQTIRAQSGGRRVDDAALRSAGSTGEDWITYGGDMGEKRHSPLTQIDATNVTRLSAAWTFDIPGGNTAPAGGGNQEATLMVSNGVMYGITTWSVVYAVDARTGKQLWKWDPEVNRPAVLAKVCCGVVNRGVALYENKIIAPIIDGRLVALDATSGKPVWEARVDYPQNQYTLTMAPRIAKGKGHHRRERRRISRARFRRRLRCQHRPARLALLHRSRRSRPSRSRTRRCARRPRRGAVSGTRWAAVQRRGTACHTTRRPI